MNQGNADSKCIGCTELVRVHFFKAVFFCLINIDEQRAAMLRTTVWKIDISLWLAGARRQNVYVMYGCAAV